MARRFPPSTGHTLLTQHVKHLRNPAQDFARQKNPAFCKRFGGAARFGRFTDRGIALACEISAAQAELIGELGRKPPRGLAQRAGQGTHAKKGVKNFPM